MNRTLKGMAATCGIDIQPGNQEIILTKKELEAFASAIIERTVLICESYKAYGCIEDIYSSFHIKR